MIKHNWKRLRNRESMCKSMQYTVCATCDLNRRCLEEIYQQNYFAIYQFSEI